MTMTKELKENSDSSRSPSARNINSQLARETASVQLIVAPAAKAIFLIRPGQTLDVEATSSRSRLRCQV